ncbi:MAG: Ig-like domain-containing protein, partial [Lachnospiraceae bacterium]|nr:Ig-like domain-containing protein [Lachnospiraceae bacterium]
ATTREKIQSLVNAAVGSAGISGVTVKVEGFTKTEATTAAAGSIRGKITIRCGNETETVMIVQTIAKLPKTDSTGSMTEEEKASVGKLVKGLGVSEETAAKILAVAKELKVPMETLLIGENTLANHKSEGDIKGSTFQKLQAAVSKTTAKSVKLTWKKVKGADGYQVYAAKCGKANKLKLVNDTKKGSTYTQKKLKKGTAYKYVVRAYKVIDGKKITIAASKSIHAFTDGGKYGNTKSVKVNKSKVSLKKGKTYKLKASEVKAKKALKKHRKICYESSNEKVATVTSKGVIRAKAKGTCTIYVYSQNGKQKKIKVTVK